MPLTKMQAHALGAASVSNKQHQDESYPLFRGLDHVTLKYLRLTVDRLCA